MRRLAGSLLSALFLLSSGHAARAQLVLSLDTKIAVPKSHHIGGGADARFGFRFGLPRAWRFHTVMFQPEVMAGDLFLPSLGKAEEAVTISRRSIGGRAGLQFGKVDLFYYGHAGVSLSNRGIEAAYDQGGALDLRFRVWSIGLHGGREWIEHRDSPGWWIGGLHGEYHWFAW
ncbi:MAG TPA: hypothetical protein VG937_10655 [Polyangiaceae bacterium]|nr:hypothetical protein [Polyangiaceae bacterium]